MNIPEEARLADGELELIATGLDFGDRKPEWRKIADAQLFKAIPIIEKRERDELFQTLKDKSSIWVENERTNGFMMLVVMELKQWQALKSK